MKCGTIGSTTAKQVFLRALSERLLKDATKAKLAFKSNCEEFKGQKEFWFIWGKQKCPNCPISAWKKKTNNKTIKIKESIGLTFFMTF